MKNQVFNLFWILTTSILFIVSCDYLTWDLPNNQFQLDFSEISEVQSRSARASGTFNNPDNLSIDQIGYVYSTSPDPDINDNRLLANPNGQDVSEILTSLEPETKYYVKMYAVVEGSTYYSIGRSFTTMKPTLTKFASNSCASLSGVTSLFTSSNGNTASWGIGVNGQSGAYWAAPDPNGILTTSTGISYVQFNKTFNEEGIIRLWINTYNPGYSNYPPNIIVNETNLGSATQIGGNSSSFYWMQVETPLIPAGQNTIKIEFNSGSVFWDVGVDEIEFFIYE